MADYQSANVIEICKVAPPPPESSSPLPPPSSLPLTFFDILWLRFPPVQRLFFYEIPSMETPFFHTTILPNLKQSLSLLLQHYYPPLAGNLVWPHHSHKPLVEFHQGDGVSLTVAESNADFHHLSHDGFREATDFHPLIPKLEASHERVAVIALQITLFPNEGFSIGITSHHAILDGRSSTSFIKSWAEVSNFISINGESSSISMATLLPSYDRTVIDDRRGLEDLYLKEWLSIDGPNNKSLLLWSFKTPPDSIRGTFRLSRGSLEKLKQLVLRKRKEKKEIHISSFTVAAAYIWVNIVRAEGEGLRDKKGAVVIVIDGRHRLEPPLPMNYFGNCMGAREAIAERDELLVYGENGVIVAVEAIIEAIKSVELDEFLSGAENWVADIRSNFKPNDDEKLPGIAGSPRFELYSADFGWGKPKKVEMISIDKTGAVCLSDTRDGDGVEFGWVAKRNVIERFAALFAQGLEAL